MADADFGANRGDCADLSEAKGSEMKAWVLWWRYHDGSRCEVLRAYNDPKRAADDFWLKGLPI